MVSVIWEVRLGWCRLVKGGVFSIKCILEMANIKVSVCLRCVRSPIETRRPRDIQLRRRHSL